jgi:hypothetical protein
MNSLFKSSPNPEFNGIPCHFAMKCEREDCSYSHPSPKALITETAKKNAKLCRKNLMCDRADCYFGHSSPAQALHKFMTRCDELERNFRLFWTTIRSDGEHDAVLKEYLTTFIPPPLHSYVAHLIDSAEKNREEEEITAEMEECEAACDAACDAAIDAACDEQQDFDQDRDDIENQELMDGFEDELIAAEIHGAFADMNKAFTGTLHFF